MSAHLPNYYTVGPWPEIQVLGTSLPTYYVLISLTYCLCIVWFYKRCESRNLSQKHAMDIGLILLSGGFIGARLFHVLFEYPQHYLDHPIQIFYFWQGGFVFYGGFLVAYLLAYLYAHRLKLTFWLWHDTLAPVIALGYALGRLACFAAGCCYGRECELPWAVPLKQVDIVSGSITTLLRHPTQLYAAFSEFIVLGLLLWYEKRKPKLGNVFLLWLLLHSANRMVMEFFRDDPRGDFYVSLSISTWISLALFATATFLLLNPKALKRA